MMTRKQKRVLDFVRSFAATYQFMPTVREVAVGLGMSVKSISAVSGHMNALVRQGYLSRNGKRFDMGDTASIQAQNPVAHGTADLQASVVKP